MNIHNLNILLMKRLNFLKILICLFLSATMLVNQASAQMPQRRANQVSIIGWTDDSHYQIRKFDSDKNPVIQSVDIKTGREVVVPPVKTEREIFSQSLPEGITLAMNDILSPDKKSVVINKDNDLVLFYHRGQRIKQINTR